MWFYPFSSFQSCQRTEELNGNVDIVCIGDKVKAQILRTYADKVKLAFNGVGKEETKFH